MKSHLSSLQNNNSMMNILIAIVSDSYTDAMRRSAPLFWSARVVSVNPIR
jgi:hypothetical protein